ncbi:MAG: SusF/SusE family outer membrane protein [Lewinellaceae bacterium]|nr:SusF/SusE family outer membrane protein [Lewinellaceae bacterium]
MKNIIKTSLLLLGVFALFFACKKEELDTTALTDFPPGVLSVTPSDGSVVGSGQNFDIVVKFVSGSVSTLASTTVTLTDEGGTEIKSETKSLSNTADSIAMAGTSFNAAGLALGKYKIVVSVTDTKGKTQSRTTGFTIGIKPLIGIIGSATADGWNSDTDMPEVAPGVYELVVTLIDGEAKFRADNAWTVNWGAASFPTGTGTQDGPNIPVPAGTWKVRFEFPSGAYSFTPAVTFASNADGLYLLGTFNNFQGDEYKFNLVDDNTWVLKEILMKPGQLFKFAEDPFFMGQNWGDNAPADGKADQFGDNITFSAPEGEAFYKCTFNDKTRLYKFEFVKYNLISIIGSATPGGWDTDTDLENQGNGNFGITLDLVAGEAKFRAGHDWAVNWGAGDFPTGTGTANGANIPIPAAGKYKVTFTPATGAYSFELDAGIQSVGIIGSATPGDWAAETPMRKNGDGTYSLVIGLKGGEAKFRANNDWAVNWGANAFPAGTGVQNGDNIPITQGLYLVNFDPATGAYSFTPTTIGIIGDATPGGWNDDTDMTIDGADAAIQTATITLTGGGAKFRAGDSWDFNWGAAAFPSGTGTYNGDNIPVTAGTYTVTFNVNTGQYSFN